MMELEIPLFRVRAGRSIEFQDQASSNPSLHPRRDSSASRSLALGHRLVQAVESGEAEDFSTMARSLGITSARVSQLVALTFLAPDIQEAILGQLSGIERLTIHHLLLVARLRNWQEQRCFWAGLRVSHESVRDPIAIP
jgi:hypothetical protein